MVVVGVVGVSSNYQAKSVSAIWKHDLDGNCIGLESPDLPITAVQWCVQDCTLGGRTCAAQAVYVSATDNRWQQHIGGISVLLICTLVFTHLYLVV